MTLRSAEPADLDALVRLETAAFATDRMSRASYRRLIARTSAEVLVAEDAGVLLGSAVVLFRRGLAAARLYSVAVDPAARGRGLGRALVEEALRVAEDRERLFLRLEVRTDNGEAIRLYERLGFRRLGRVDDYYEDGGAAYRYERAVVPHHEPPHHLAVPYYAQTLDFTCGAACLLMALGHFDPALPLDRSLELDLWRAATTIFMMSGLGGCSAEGLAVAAVRRGLHARVVTNEPDVPFIRSVRRAEKKEVITLVHRDFVRRLDASGHPPQYRTFDRADITRAVDAGQVPILLVSGYRLYGEKAPHWVVVTGYDDHFVYIHDPFIPADAPRFDGRHVPIHERDFTGMHRYGTRGTRTMILLSDAPFDGA